MDEEARPVSVKLLQENMELDSGDLLCWLRTDYGVAALLNESNPRKESRHMLVKAFAKVSMGNTSEMLSEVLERF